MSFGLGLGLSLGGRAGGSRFPALGPSLDLIFAGASTGGTPNANNSLDLDFTAQQYSVGSPYSVWSGSRMLPENFQDIITFSRASANATYTNSSGFITTAGVLNYLTYSGTPDSAGWQKADSFIQTNLLLYSQEFETGWLQSALQTLTPNAEIAPNGTLTADLIIPNTATADHRVTQTSAVTAGVTYTASVYSKAAGYPFVDFVPFTTPSNTVVSFTTTSTDAGNGWLRRSCTFTVPVGDTGVQVRIVVNNGAGQNFGGNGTSGVYIWGAQLVQGTVPGDYVATTSATLPVLYADYNNVLRARKVCQSNTVALPHGLRQVIASTLLTGNSVYTLSFYAKAGESTKANSWGFSAAAFIATSAAIFDLVAGTATGDGSPTITAVGNGWYRCTKTLTAAASPTSGTVHVGPTDAAGSQSYNGDGTSGIYIADIQLELSSTVGSYYETTANPYNAPRFDYTPDTRGVGAELVTNGDFAVSTGWTLGAGGVTISGGTANFAAVNSTTALYRSATVTVGKTYQITTVVNSVTAGSIQPRLFGGATPVTITSAGTVGTFGTGSTSTITAVGSGWYRCTLSFNVPSSSNWQIYIVSSASATYGLAFTATVASLFLWGAQLEAGAFASSYIPTTASQLTRAADIATINTLTPWFNQKAGVIFAEASVRAGTVLNALAAFNSGTTYSTGNGFLVRSVSASSVSAGGNSSNVSASPISADTIFRTAGGYQGVNQFVCLNGGAVSGNAICDFTGIGTAALTLSSLTPVSAAQQANGWLRRISYYPRRLTDAELQTLTT